MCIRDSLLGHELAEADLLDLLRFLEVLFALREGLGDVLDLVGELVQLAAKAGDLRLARGDMRRGLVPQPAEADRLHAALPVDLLLEPVANDLGEVGVAAPLEDLGKLPLL
eukprot:10929892-Alexandrium_andersonii.AAC.1